MRQFALGLALVLWALAASAAQEDRIIVAGAACVDSQDITLAQIARAEGEGARAVLDRIGAEPIMPSPRFDGARVNLNGAKLRDMLTQHFGPGLPRLEVPEQVLIQRGGQVVDGLALRPELDKILTRALAPLGDDVSLREHRIADYLFVSDMTPFRIRVSPVGTVGPGRISLRLEAVSEAGKVLQAFTGTVFADVWKTVPCAARVLNRGNILEPALVTFARKNLAQLARPPWDGKGLPLRMTGSVGEGQVISAESVEPIPLVEKGRTLTLVYEGRTLKLSVPVESLEDGALGEKIRVRNMQSRKVVLAKVLDKDTVLIP